MTVARLAIDGGPRAVRDKLPPWPAFDEAAIAAVQAVLRSGQVNYWTGSKGMEFEKRFAEWQGSRFAVSTTSGTAAFQVALTAMGIGPGDEVIVPSHTFIAGSFAIVQAGAVPRFADVNLEDHCLSLESAEHLINERTRAVMPVHLYGNVCDMDPLRSFAKRYQLRVLEDNAQACGGAYKGHKTGTLGDIAGCSFCHNKTFTTGGEGGMVTTDNEEWAWMARSLRDHGTDVKQRLNLPDLEQQLPCLHKTVGWNYRMTEMQSAIGLAELNRLDTWNLPRRRRNARLILDVLEDEPLIRFRPIDTADRHNGWYAMAFSLAIEEMRCNIQEFVKALAAEGAPCGKVFWLPSHTEHAFRAHQAFGRSGFPFRSKEYAHASSVDYGRVEAPNALWHQSHSFTCFAFPTYEVQHCDQIGMAIRKVIRAYAK